MSATLFGETAETVTPKKSIFDHQLIAHYRTLLEDRLEEATSKGGILFGVFDCESFGNLMRTLFPEDYAQENWCVGSRVDVDIN